MKDILDKLVSKLNRRMSEERRDNPYEDTLVGVFTFGKHIVRFVFSKKRGCELEIWNPTLDYFLDNVAIYCENRVIGWNDVDISYTDEWNEHGFANEADYLRYRYGY